MTASIPASEIVNVIPNVIGAGGNALDLSGLFLTDGGRVPAGTVASFASAAAVSAYFGPLSTEATLAGIYFGGFDGATQAPGAMLFAPYQDADAKAWLRGGSLAGMTLAQLKAAPAGTLTINIDGTSVTSGSVNLSSATSFSNAASLIQTAIATTGVTVTFDSVASAFVIMGATAGTGGSIAYPTTNATATALKLTAATGAVLSQGAAADTPASAMASIIAQTQDWVTFSTTWEPDTDDCVSFAAWTDGQNNRYAYILWDTDAAPTTNTDTTSAGYLIIQDGYSGTVPIYDPVNAASVAAFVMGAVAAIDFDATDGRTNLAFRSQSGAIQPGVTNQVITENLIANGYNFYGRYATANDQFVFFYPGSVTGPFSWLDSYVDEIWMNNGFQLALMNLLTSIKSIPYNSVGYTLIETAMLDQVNQALDFGAIRAGVTLSSAQAQEANTMAGLKISDTLEQRGWYIVVSDPGAKVRAARGSPNVYFFYTDGQSVQRITLTSTQVQ